MLDIYDDKGALLRKYYPSKEDLPDWFVKSGIPAYDMQKFASSDFAVTVPLRDGIKYAFPIMNDAATACSVLYFDHTHKNLPESLQKKAAAALLEACDRFNIEATETITKLATDYQEKTHNANLTKKPFLSQGIAGSQMFPLSTPEQVKIACDVFPQIMLKLSPDERREFALNLQEKIAEFGVELTEEQYVLINRWGGDRLSKSAAWLAIEKRAELMSESQRQLLYKAANNILDMDPDSVSKFLTKLDSELGLEFLYDRKIPDPQSIHEKSPEKVAMAKIAEGVEIPMEWWKSAVDQGALDAFSPPLREILKSKPDMLLNYQDTPVYEYVIDRLVDLGMVDRIEEPV